jgi:Aminoarabinose transferase C-terminal domain
VVFIFAFFSASSSKLAGYIVPIFPALAMLMGLALARSSRWQWRGSVLLTLILALAGVVACQWIPSMAPPTMLEGIKNLDQISAYVAYQHVVQLGLGVLALTALLALGLEFLNAQRQGDAGHAGRGKSSLGVPVVPVGAALLLAFGAYAATQGLMLGHENLRDSGASSYGLARSIAQAQARLGPAQEYNLFFVNDFDHTLPFYLKKTGLMVIDRDEHDFGLKQSPELFLPDLASFAARWKASPRAAAVMYHKTLRELDAFGLAYEVVGRDTLRVAIIKSQP